MINKTDANHPTIYDAEAEPRPVITISTILFRVDIFADNETSNPVNARKMLSFKGLFYKKKRVFVVNFK